MEMKMRSQLLVPVVSILLLLVPLCQAAATTGLSSVRSSTANTPATSSFSYHESAPKHPRQRRTQEADNTTLLQPITNSNIHFAVKEWVHNQDAAIAKFGHIRHWNTSHVYDMSHLFSWERAPALSQFNDNITMWDTHKVTNLSRAFFGNAVMNFDLAKWDVSRVVDMTACFANTQHYEGHDLRTWDTAKVANMSRMFQNAAAFDSHGVHLWNTQSLVDASLMFHGAKAFKGAEKFQWATTHLKDMSEMFLGAEAFVGDLSGLDVSSVTSMKGTFFQALKFNSDLTNWNTSKVHDMNSMFSYAAAFVGTGLPFWNVGKVTNMANMLKRSNFDQNLNNWDVQKVEDMRGMFRYDSEMKQKVCWTLHNNVNVDGIFFQSKSFFDRTCVKHAAVVASCCRPSLDNACECGDATINEDNMVDGIGSITSSPGGDPSSVGATSTGKKSKSAFGIFVLVTSLLILVVFVVRVIRRRSVITIEVGDADDWDVSDMDFPHVIYPKPGDTVPPNSTRSFSSNESEEDVGPLEDINVREII
jgi:surface protein